eukprot:364189-Chlamydomonas_euryale.AAC.19
MGTHGNVQLTHGDARAAMLRGRVKTEAQHDMPRPALLSHHRNPIAHSPNTQIQGPDLTS